MRERGREREITGEVATEGGPGDIKQVLERFVRLRNLYFILWGHESELILVQVVALVV